jgi:hypothetical protein
MISSHLTYRAGLTRIDDLRREGEDRRRVKLARSERNTPAGAIEREQRPRVNRVEHLRPPGGAVALRHLSRLI